MPLIGRGGERPRVRAWSLSGRGLVGVVGLLLLALWLFGRWAAVYLASFVDWVGGLGALAPVVFIAGYVLSTLLLIPASILTLAAGVLFGVLEGTLYAFTGGLLSAVAAFLISRYAARRAVKRRLSRDARFLRIDRAISRQGFQVVFLLRLSPILPFAVVNYALGITRVRLMDYTLGTIGLLPPTWLYVYNGKLMGEATGLRFGTVVAGEPGNWVVLALGLTATALVTVWLARVTRRVLR